MYIKGRYKILAFVGIILASFFIEKHMYAMENFSSDTDEDEDQDRRPPRRERRPVSQAKLLKLDELEDTVPTSFSGKDETDREDEKGSDDDESNRDGIEIEGITDALSSSSEREDDDEDVPLQVPGNLRNSDDQRLLASPSLGRGEEGNDIEASRADAKSPTSSDHEGSNADDEETHPDASHLPKKFPKKKS